MIGRERARVTASEKQLRGRKRDKDRESETGSKRQIRERERTSSRDSRVSPQIMVTQGTWI